MRVLVACEFSGVVREAFRKRGHDAWSCDILPSEDYTQWHIEGDVIRVLRDNWDLIIAHPPCTHLASSGARWFSSKIDEQLDAIEFVRAIVNAPVGKLAIENPVGILSRPANLGRPTQIVQPFNFGDPFKKTTCLWLRGLPPLRPTSDLQTGEQKCWKEPPHPDRWKRRSRTYQGIANAMAEQWGSQ